MPPLPAAPYGRSTKALITRTRSTPDAHRPPSARLALWPGRRGLPALVLLASLVPALAGCAGPPSSGQAPSGPPSSGQASEPAPSSRPAPSHGLGSPGPVTHYRPAPATIQDGPDCRNATFGMASEKLAPGMGTVPEGFVPVSAVECSPDFSAPSVTAGVPMTVERHLTGDFAPLLAALAEPSDRQDGIFCTAMLPLIPDLWLVNSAGKAVHVAWPLGVCGTPKPDTEKALAGLTVKSTTTIPRSP